MSALARLVQVNLPFDMIETYGPELLARGGSPEIGLSARVLDGVPQDRLQVWAERLARTAVTLHGPFMDLAPGGVDPLIVQATRRRFLQAAKLTGLFQARALVLHAGYDFSRYPYDRDRWLEVAAETWRLVLEATEKSQTLILVENVFEREPDIISRLLARMDHPRLGFCFDTGHFNTWSQAPLMDWLTRLGPWLKRLHLHDNDGSFDQHLPIGQGNFDFKALWAWLKEKGLRPGITLEPHTEEDFRLTFLAFKQLLKEENWWPGGSEI
ncbi:MAG: sugar phosphate isomerase/epimerase [Deltaproteobacteria bacterium]|nr:sugar phosphate isomerase/epimerase [Deltaproteobacteria bacterium]